MCVLGYCVFPLLVSAVCCLITSLFGWTNVFLRVAFVLVGFVWATRGQFTFIRLPQTHVLDVFLQSCAPRCAHFFVSMVMLRLVWLMDATECVVLSVRAGSAFFLGSAARASVSLFSFLTCPELLRDTCPRSFFIVYVSVQRARHRGEGKPCAPPPTLLRSFFGRLGSARCVDLVGLSTHNLAVFLERSPTFDFS